MFDNAQPFYGADYQLRRFPGGDEQEFHVHQISYSESLNEGYVLRVQCDIHDDIVKHPRSACAVRRGQDVQLLIRRQFPNGKRLLETRISGVIQSVQRTLDDNRAATFQLTIVPAYSLLSTDVGGGVWCDVSEKDVLVEVLKRSLSSIAQTPRSVDSSRLCGVYPVVDHIVRADGESLFDFARTLMARTGINAYFRHAHDQPEVLVLCDNNDGFAALEHHLEDDPILLPRWRNLNADSHEEIRSAEYAALSEPSKFEIQGFDICSLSGTPVTSRYACDGGTNNTARFSTDVRTNERENAQTCLDRRAKLHGEALETSHNAIRLETTFSGCLAGRTFRANLDGITARDYVIMSVAASGHRYADHGVHADRPDDYINSITVAPTQTDGDVPLTIRSPAAAPPRTYPGVYRAEIIAIENSPVDVSESLRCRIKYTWDEETSAEKTTYVSVLQPSAGTHGGTQWIPRAGDRCFVAFIGGNPERPVILGFAYDSENKPPAMGPGRASLPQSSSWLGWNYSSIGDKSRNTMLCMDVTAGHELMYFQAPKDWRQEIGRQGHDVDDAHGDHHVMIGRHSNCNIGGDRHEHIRRHRQEYVHGCHREHVHEHYTLRVDGDADVAVGGDVIWRYSHDVAYTYHGAYWSHIHRGADVKIEEGYRQQVLTGDKTTRVDSGNMATQVSSGSYSLSAASHCHIGANAVNLSAGGTLGKAAHAGNLAMDHTSAALTAPSEVTLQTGAARVQSTPQEITAQAATVAIHDQMGGTARMSGGSYLIDVPQGITFRCGATYVHIGPEGVYINGQLIQLTGIRTEIQAALLDVNPLPVPDAP